MAPPTKRQRQENICAAPETPTIHAAWILPVDILLEIVARSDLHTLVRFAGACKLLRREILGPSFISRVSRHTAPCILSYLCTDGDMPFTLVHPVNPATAAFCRRHLYPFFSRHAASLFDQYSVVASRRGLILLRRFTFHRMSIYNRPDSEQCSDLCVYNPMTGARTFLSCPPPDNERSTIDSCRKYVLLTAADGIDCSFLLLQLYLCRWRINVRTASSCGKWGRVTRVRTHDFRWGAAERCRDPAVLYSGVLHWLVYRDKQILRYNLGTRKLDSFKFPHTNCDFNQLHLATSSDGKLLKLLVIEGFIMFVWLQLSTSTTGDSGWSLETVIDMEDKLRLLHPDIPPNGPDHKLIIFDYSEKGSGDVVLLRVPGPGYYYIVTVFDLETKDMHTHKVGYSLLEIDLPSRLRNMKIFS